MIWDGAISPHCLVAMGALAVAGVVIVALICSRIRLRRLLCQQKMLLESLPLRFLVCDREGRIVQWHADDANIPDAGQIRTIPGLPEAEADIAVIAEQVRRSFASDEVEVRDLPISGRCGLARRLPKAAFGCETVMLVSLDVSRQNKQQRRVEEKLFELQEVLEAIAAGIVVVDGYGKISMMNSHAARMTGWSVSLAEGMDYRRIVAPASAPGEEIAAVLQKGKDAVWCGETELPRRDGAAFPVRLRMVPLVGSRKGEHRAVLAFWDESVVAAERRELAWRGLALEITADLTRSGHFRYSPITRETQCGRNFEELWPFRNGVPLPEREWIYREDADEFMRRRDRLIAGEDAIFEMNYRSDFFGKMRYYRIRAVLERNGSEQLRDFTVFGVIQDISDITENARQHNESVFQLKMLLELFPCPFFIKEVSDEYRYRMCSHAWFEVMNLSADETINHHDFELFPEDFARTLRNIDQEANVSGRTMQVVETPGGGRPEDKRMYRMIVDAYTTPEGKRMLFGAGLDFSDAEKANRRQMEQRQFYEEILNRLPACVLVKDADDGFRYVVWNKMLEEHTGFTADQVLGKDDFEVAPYPGSASSFRDGDISALKTEGTEMFREGITSATGRRFYYGTTKTVIRTGEKRYIAELCLDMSREHELEERTQEMLQELNRHVIGADIINSCLKRITVENDFEKAVNDMLLIVGGASGADRAYIFLYSEMPDTLNCSLEWVREGIMPRGPQNRHMELQYFTAVQELLESRQYIAVDDITRLPEALAPCAALLREQQIQSMLLTGISIEGKLHGVLGIDFVREKQPISQGCIRTLQDAVSIYLLAYQRKQQFDTIAESAANQRLIIDMVNVPLLLINRDFTVAHANQSVLQMAGAKSEEVIGHKCFAHLCQLEASGEECMVRESFESGTPITAELRLWGRDFQVTTMPIVHDGAVVQVLESFMDLTEINKSKELLRQAARDAAEAARTKSLFLATVSHELRTPLNAVIGFAELLQMGGMSSGEADEAIKSIHLAGNTLLNLINDVLDLSKLEAGQMTLVPARTNLAGVLDELRRIFDHKLRENNVAGETIMPPDLPWLYLDGLRLRQILLNLIGNAVKFTPQGAITVEVEFQRRGDGRGDLLIRVRDTGIGIGSEYLSKIFEPFVQEEHRDRFLYQGSGLGLAICRRLVEQMNGILSAESTLGQGSCFTVRLPEVRFDEGPILPGAVKPAFTDGIEARVILVDDVAMNLKVLEAMARKLKLVTVSCTSGAEALELAQSFAPDIILTDMWMPEMNGLELAKAIKANAALRDIRVVAVTADAEVVSGSSQHIFDGILLKPITLEKLNVVLQKVFRDRNEAATNRGA